MQNLFKEIKQKADELVKEASELSELINTSSLGIKPELEGVLDSTERILTEEEDEENDLINKCDNEGIDGYHEERDRNL